MKNEQENKLAMNNAVHTYLENNSAIVSTIAELENSKNDLKTGMDAIIGKEKQRDDLLKGKTQNKADARNELIERSMVIIGAHIGSW